MNNWINKPTHIPLNKYHYTSIYQSTISGDGLYGIHVVSIKQAHSAHPAPQSHAQPWWLERKLWRRNSSQFRFVLSSSFFFYSHDICSSYFNFLLFPMDVLWFQFLHPIPGLSFASFSRPRIFRPRRHRSSEHSPDIASAGESTRFQSGCLLPWWNGDWLVVQCAHGFIVINSIL